MSLGPDGLRTVSDIAVLNNNYLRKLFAEIRGVAMWYTEPRRMHEIRWSFENCRRRRGSEWWRSDPDCLTMVLERRSSVIIRGSFPSPDSGADGNVPKAEVEEFAAVVNRVCEEAYSDPDLVKSAPHKSAWGLMDYGFPADFSGLATSRRAMLTRYEDIAAE